jgi:hypothetical protein
MAIKRRLTDEERFQTEVGPNWKQALLHPLLYGMVQFAKYPSDPASITKAIGRVRSWKGAHYTDKVFVFLLASVLYRANGESFLQNAAYDKLRDHLFRHEQDVLESCGLHFHGPMVWDHRKLTKVTPGELSLPAAAGKKPKRKKLKRHRK